MSRHLELALDDDLRRIAEDASSIIRGDYRREKLNDLMLIQIVRLLRKISEKDEASHERS